MAKPKEDLSKILANTEKDNKCVVLEVIKNGTYSRVEKVRKDGNIFVRKYYHEDQQIIGDLSRSDIFSIGKTLLFMITGLEPKRHLDQTLLGTLPEILQRVIYLSTNFTPQFRYSSVNDMIKDLRSAEDTLLCDDTLTQTSPMNNVLQNIPMHSLWNSSQTDGLSVTRPHAAIIKQSRNLLPLIAGLVAFILLAGFGIVFLITSKDTPPVDAVAAVVEDDVQEEENLIT